MSFVEERTAWEKQYWQAMLYKCGGSMTMVAYESGCNRQNIYKILNRLGIAHGHAAHGNPEWQALKEAER